jgi:hypothetical protein
MDHQASSRQQSFCGFPDERYVSCKWWTTHPIRWAAARRAALAQRRGPWTFALGFGQFVLSRFGNDQIEDRHFTNYRKGGRP